MLDLLTKLTKSILSKWQFSQPDFFRILSAILSAADKKRLTKLLKKQKTVSFWQNCRQKWLTKYLRNDLNECFFACWTKWCLCSKNCRKHHIIQHVALPKIISIKITNDYLNVYREMIAFLLYDDDHNDGSCSHVYYIYTCFVGELHRSTSYDDHFQFTKKHWRKRSASCRLELLHTSTIPYTFRIQQLLQSKTGSNH